MRKAFKYLSYAIIYCIISIASAYGVITLSLHNSLNQQSQGSGNGNSEVVLPAQLNAIVENMTSTNYINVDLDVGVNYNSQNYLVGINALADMSNGLDNVSAQGTIDATILENNTTYNIGFAYIDNNLYLDVMGGKMVLQTSSLMSFITEIMSMLNIKMPELELDMEGMDLNSILGLFSNLKEEKIEDSKDLRLLIALPVVEKDLVLICDENYNIKSLSCDVALEEFNVTVNGGLNYPEDASVSDKEPNDYVNVANLLDVAKSAINYIQNNENYAFKLNAKALGYDLDAYVYVDYKNGAGKFTMNIDKYELNLIYQNETIFVEIGNVFAKFELKDLNKIQDFLHNSFNIDLPLDKITSLMENLKNGKLLESVGSFDVNNFDPSTLDLSILERVYVEDNMTYAVVKNIGTLGFKTEEEMLKSINFANEQANVTLQTVNFKAFTLRDEDDYINLASLLPTAENAVSILKSDTLKLKLDVAYKGVNVPVEIKLKKLNNKVYVNIAEKVKLCIDTNTFTDSLVKFISEINLEADLRELVAAAGGISEIINPKINPMLIKSLTQTRNGFDLTLFNDMLITLTNYTNEILVSTTLSDANLSLRIGVYDDPTFDETQYNNIDSVLNLTKVFINSGLFNVAQGAFNLLKDGKIALDFDLNANKVAVSGKLYADIMNKKASIALQYKKELINLNLLNEIVYIDYNNVFVKYALKDLPKLADLLKVQFKLDLPLDFINNLPIDLISSIFSAINAGDYQEAYKLISEKLAKVERLDFDKIDMTFFDKIKVEGNDTIVSVKDNLITFTTSNKLLTAIKFSGLGINLNANVVDYQNSNLPVPEYKYIDLAILLPSINNAINIVRSNTISGQFNLTIGELDLNFTLTIATDNDIYVEIATELLNSVLKITYSNKKIYINYGNRIKLLTSLDKLPSQIKELSKGIDTLIDPILDLIGIDKNSLTVDSLKEFLNPSINPFLFKSLSKIKNTDGFKLTLYNNMVITVTNKEKILDITMNSINANFSGSLEGKENLTTRATFNDADYVTIDKVFRLINAAKNMSKREDFHIQGKITISLLGFIDFDANLDIYIKVVNGKLQIIIELTLPDAVSLVARTTASDRKIKIYYMDGDIYIYRFEKKGLVFKKDHEVCVKLTLADLMADPLTYVQFAFDFTDKIMEAMTKATDHGRVNDKDNPNPYYELIFDRAFTKFEVSESTDQTKYVMGVNLKELVDNSNLGEMEITLNIGENENNESYLKDLGLNLSLVGGFVGIKTPSSQNIQIVNYGSPVDEKMKELYSYASSYTFDYKLQMERTDNGNWTQIPKK